MKKIILSALMLFSAATAFSQARKPIIMVIPSDIYCTRAGYVTTYQDESGNTQTAADYSKAFLNDENLRLAISEMSSIMAERGFPLKDLEQTLKSMENQQAEAALFSGTGGGSIYESPLDKLKRFWTWISAYTPVALENTYRSTSEVLMPIPTKSLHRLPVRVLLLQPYL